MTETSRPAPPRSIWSGLPVRAGAVAVVAIVVAVIGLVWINGQRDTASTDDAYVQADKNLVSPKVRGAVLEVLVHENQAVKAGDPLVRIDPEEYDLKLTAAQGDLMAQSALGELYADGLGEGEAATYEGMYKHNVSTIVKALQ